MDQPLVVHKAQFEMLKTYMYVRKRYIRGPDSY